MRASHARIAVISVISWRWSVFLFITVSARTMKVEIWMNFSIVLLRRPKIVVSSFEPYERNSLLRRSLNLAMLMLMSKSGGSWAFSKVNSG